MKGSGMINQCTILLIDDNADFLSTLQPHLESEGYKIIVAQNAITGWEEMERCQPDIILVDWEMPGMNGIELVRLIKANPAHRNRYVIMITGRGGTKSIVQGLDVGADDYLTKVFEMEELKARIRCGLRVRNLELRIAEETKHSTVVEMAMSISDKIGNPIAAAKLYQQMLIENSDRASTADRLESLSALGQLLDEALHLINKYQSIKNPHSVPAPGGKTMIGLE
jgi:DNA-binding response OmpR family regulator